MKPTKQQAISLHLAKWLYAGERIIVNRYGEVVINPKPIFEPIIKFNPFASTTEGRAQFAECWEKAAESFHNLETYDKGVEARNGQGDDCYRVEMGGVGSRYAFLEAIYYATGGKAEDLE